MSETQITQRLVAILAADAAGYSRLMAQDDRATVAALDAARTVFRLHIEAHRGRVIDMAGDSVLAIFETTLGAVCAALAVQQNLHAASAAVEPGQQLQFRIGVHLGDLIEKPDGSVYGDGVNIAARIQALAEPGSVSVSDAVRGAVRGKVAAEFVDQGEKSVKNIADPIRVFQVAPTGDTATAAPSLARATAPAMPDKPSLAVLPFTNMSGDPEQAYFADGLTEDIITDVSKLSGLLVIARNSSFSFRDQQVDVREIGRKLGVGHVLEGSVRKAGAQVRINAQLIDVASGGHLWAERFDRQLSDIFALQDDVTRCIVEALKIRLAPTDKAMHGGARSRDVRAHDSFLRGRELLYGSLGTNLATMSAEKFARVIATFRQAIEFDHLYAQAYAGMSIAYCLDFQNRWTHTVDSLELASHFAAKAIEIDADSPYGYYAAAVAAFWKRDLSRAVTLADKALALNTNYALAYGTRGLTEIYLGRPLTAVAFIQRAIVLDPFFTQQYVHFLGSAYLVAGQYESAVASFEERIRLAPRTDLSRAFLSCALGHLGRFDEAQRVWRELQQINPNYSLAGHLARLPFQNPADLAHIEAGLAKAGLPA